MVRQLKLESSDGEVVTIDTEIIRQSQTIDEMLRELPDQQDDEEPIPLANINGNILRTGFKSVKICKTLKFENCFSCFTTRVKT